MDILNFTLTWDSSLELCDDYTISVHPSPTHGPSNWTINGSSSNLALSIITEHNITLSISAYGLSTVHFSLGMSFI